MGFGIDWWTKYLAAHILSPGEPRSVIGHWLEFVLVYNKAAVFGLDPRHLIPWFPLNTFFSIFMVVAAGILILYYRHLQKSDRLMHGAIMFILPGALGNLFDRVLHAPQGVVDFIKVDLGFRPFNPWPIFNMADAWVTIGVALMLVSFLFAERAAKKVPVNEDKSDSAGEAAGGDGTKLSESR